MNHEHMTKDIPKMLEHRLETPTLKIQILGLSWFGRYSRSTLESIVDAVNPV